MPTVFRRMIVKTGRLRGTIIAYPSCSVMRHGRQEASPVLMEVWGCWGWPGRGEAERLGAKS